MYTDVDTHLIYFDIFKMSYISEKRKYLSSLQAALLILHLLIRNNLPTMLASYFLMFKRVYFELS
jgi:hypothetical protein